MTRRSWLMLVATAAVWGSSYMFIKVALDDFSEGAIVCLRTALGAALLLSFAAHRGVLSDLRGRAKWMAKHGQRRFGRFLPSKSLPTSRRKRKLYSLPLRPFPTCIG